MHINPFAEKTPQDYQIALTQFVVGLVAMAGFSLASLAEDAKGKTISRKLRSVILRLLRPAESAARRLVVALAAALSDDERAKLSKPPRSAKYKPPRGASSFKNRPGLVAPNGYVLFDGPDLDTVYMMPAKPPVRVGKRRPGAPVTPRRPLRFQLVDRRKKFGRRRRRKYVPAHLAPRIWILGNDPPPRPPPPQKPRPDDAMDAARLGERLAALLAALNDMPGEAKRLVRWTARQQRIRIHNDARSAAGLPARRNAAGRTAFGLGSPLRPGPAPGEHPKRPDLMAPRRRDRRNHDERVVDDILEAAHALARSARPRLDSS